jgi:hypothetical protein
MSFALSHVFLTSPYSAQDAGGATTFSDGMDPIYFSTSGSSLVVSLSPDGQWISKLPASVASARPKCERPVVRKWRRLMQSS